MSRHRRGENPNYGPQASRDFDRRYAAEMDRLLGREGGGGLARGAGGGNYAGPPGREFGGGPPLRELDTGRHYGTEVSGLTGLGSAREAMMVRRREREGRKNDSRSHRDGGGERRSRSGDRRRSRPWEEDCFGRQLRDNYYADAPRMDWDGPVDRRYQRERSRSRRRSSGRRSRSRSPRRQDRRRRRDEGRRRGHSSRSRSGSSGTSSRGRSHSSNHRRRRRSGRREGARNNRRDERRNRRCRRDEGSPSPDAERPRNRRNPNDGEGHREGGNDSPTFIVSEDSDNPHGGGAAAAGEREETNAAATGTGNDNEQEDEKKKADGTDASPRKRSSGPGEYDTANSRRKDRRHKSSRRRRSPSESSHASRSPSRRSHSSHRCYNPAPRGLTLEHYDFPSQREDKRLRSRSYSPSRDRYDDEARSSRRRGGKRKRTKRRRCRSASVESRSRSGRPGRLGHSRGKRERGSEDRSPSPSPGGNRKRRRRRHEHSFSRSESRSRNNGRLSRRAKKKSKKKKKKSHRHQSGNKSDSSKDDTVGHFRGGPGTMIDGRYRIIRDVGMGTFGRVVQCERVRGSERRSSSRMRSASCDRYDDGDNRTVAIKIVRSVPRYHESALIEGDICERVNREQSRQNKDLCARMLDRFSLSSGHYCLVFECLGCSLYDYLKAHDYAPFPMYCVRDFSRQLLEVLDFLHGFGLIHTDLKPENILLASNGETTYRSWDGSSARVPVTTKVKVIDFGGATYNDEKKSSIVNTRQYRAPEVILGWGWSYPSDLWSAGCIIAELYQGELLFATHDNAEHLALMERAVGPFPKDLLDHATSPLAKECFDSRGWHKIKGVLSSRSIEHVREMKPIEQMVLEHDRSTGLGHLLRSLLIIDPNRRATAREALMSPFFTQLG